jgi:prefoldin subunit 5
MEERREKSDAAISGLQSKIRQLESEAVDHKSKSDKLYSSLTDVLTELADCKQQLEALQESAKREVADRMAAIEAEFSGKLSQLEKRNAELEASLTSQQTNVSEKLSQLEKKNAELEAALQADEEKLEDSSSTARKLLEDKEQLSLELRRLRELGDSGCAEKCLAIKEECKTATESALAEQKSRYEARMKQIVEKVKAQYKAEIEKSVSKWTSDFRCPF